MKVFIMGLTGAGKTNLAKIIAKKFNLTYYPYSLLFRKFMGFDAKTKSWWIHNGLKFMKESVQKKNYEYLYKFDKYILNILKKQDDFVTDSWTLPWIYGGNALRVMLTAPLEVRIKNVMSRDKIAHKDAKKKIVLKDKLSRELYLKTYGFDITKDFSNFDLVINIEYFNKRNAKKFICDFVKNYKIHSK